MPPRPQVRLVPATVPSLTALVDDPARFAELLGSPVPDGWPEFPEAVGAALAHLRDPDAGAVWEWRWTRSTGSSDAVVAWVACTIDCPDADPGASARQQR